jgi:hypothetical protein
VRDDSIRRGERKEKRERRRDVMEKTDAEKKGWRKKEDVKENKLF